MRYVPRVCVRERPHHAALRCRSPCPVVGSANGRSVPHFPLLHGTRRVCNPRPATRTLTRTYPRTPARTHARRLIALEHARALAMALTYNVHHATDAVRRQQRGAHNMQHPTCKMYHGMQGWPWHGMAWQARKRRNRPASLPEHTARHFGEEESGAPDIDRLCIWAPACALGAQRCGTYARGVKRCGTYARGVSLCVCACVCVCVCVCMLVRGLCRSVCGGRRGRRVPRQQQGRVT